MRIYERINAYVKNSGVKQYVIAQKAGYNPRQFSAMMTGRKSVSGDDVEKICAALNVAADEFIKPELTKAG